MYIFGYFFQKGHFKGSSKKRAHRQKFWGGSWRPNGHPLPLLRSGRPVLWIKGSHQNLNFENFECSGENLQNSSCHFPNHKPIFLQILHHSLVPWKITPLYFFGSNIIYFGQKRAHQSAGFETSECSVQNSSNPSCQCWNGRSIPLQILHHSSLSWHITPL